MDRDRKILITGAAGNVARGILPFLKARYSRLRLSDIAESPQNEEEFVRCNLSDFDSVRRITQGCDAILHFGGIPREAHWNDIRDANLSGSYNILEAARREGIERVVLASSTHAVGFEERASLTPAERNYRPDSLYGASKVFGEALGSFYADRYGMQVMALRIGLYAAAPRARRNLANWVHAEDLAQLCMIGLDHPSLGYSVVYGVSQTDHPIFANSRADELGYRPRHSSRDYTAAVAHLAESTDGYVGGPFVEGPSQDEFE